MAGDWIKMRGNLWDDPRVAALVDATESSEAAVIGGLYWLWATADQHTEDGIMPGLTLRAIDRKTGIKGLGDALVDIGWLADHPEGVRIVNFEDHNGSSAKRRSLDAQRKANIRSVSASDADKTQTDDGQNAPDCGAREEKRREEKKTSVAKATGADAPPTRPVIDLKDQVFAVGVTLLTAAEVSDKNARSFLAAQLKAHGPERLLEALQVCASERAVQPVPWLVDHLKTSPHAPRGAAEPAWRTEQRTRTQQAAPGVAVGAVPADQFFIDAEARVLPAIGVSQ